MRAVRETSLQVPSQTWQLRGLYLFESAVGVSEVLKMGWGGESDEFSEWMEKFKVEVKKA